MEDRLLSDFLRELGVPHTESYTSRRFAQMPFPTLFGLQKLLEEYGVPSQGYSLSDKSDLLKFPTPFLAHTPKGFLIVTSTSGGNVAYLTQGVKESMPQKEFCEVADGIVFLAMPTKQSREPDYAANLRMQWIARAKKIGLWVLAGLLFAWLFVSNGLWMHLSTILLVLFDLGGLLLTFLLVQKSLKIKNAAADRFCGVLQKGGCDHVLEDKASTFYGIFSWSEVGMAYFSVSLLALLIFPQWISYLAACNVCCLPFTFWSIWYQKFRAKAWCTLCVSVQATLWALFFCFLAGGWLNGIFPIKIEFFVLVASYGFVLLLLNRIMPLLKKKDD